MTSSVTIRSVSREPGLSGALADLLIDVVEGGASVGFMLPLSHQQAVRFWEGVLDSVERGERILLIAEEVPSRHIVGTVQLIVAMPDNQPHRADVAKMQVHRRARRQGVGAALMRAVESAAVEAGKTVLVLDTVTDSIVSEARLAAMRGDPKLRPLAGWGILQHDLVLPSARSRCPGLNLNGHSSTHG